MAILPLAIVFGVVVVLSVATILLYAARPRGHAANPRCGHCGYNLTGAPANRCPECGRLFIDVGVIPPYPAAGQKRLPRILVVLLLGGIALIVVVAVWITTRAQAAITAAQAQQRALQTQARAAVARQAAAQAALADPNTTTPEQSRMSP